MSELMEIGRQVVADGRLKQLRKDLGLNRSSMAEFLHTSLMTYNIWERRPGTALWPSTAERIGRFYRLALMQYQMLLDSGVNLDDLLPLHHVTTVLGAPQELLMKRYREGRFDGMDLGILGLWFFKDDLEEIRGSL